MIAKQKNEFISSFYLFFLGFCFLDATRAALNLLKPSSRGRPAAWLVSQRLVWEISLILVQQSRAEQSRKCIYSLCGFRLTIPSTCTTAQMLEKYIVVLPSTAAGEKKVG